MPTLYIIRGLPGSGKSTLAKAMAIACTCNFFEADMYFTNTITGEYMFSMMDLPKAHEWCKNEVFMKIQAGKDVIVSNTFTTKQEMMPYIEFARRYSYRVQFIECKGQWKNIHNVPEHTIERMRARWESI